MEVRSLQSPRITGVPSALTRTRLREKPFASGQALKILNRKRCPAATKLKLLGFRARASGSTKFSSEAVEANQKDANSKDDNLVFVAGATGRVGSRTIRELLKLGFKVRVGVRSPQRAESLLQSVEQMKLGVEVASEGWKPIERLEIVECDLEKLNQIGPALGNASVVICCIGASEKEVFDITGPYRIDYQATKNLIDAATIAEVNHFILLTSLGTNKIGFPAAILNLFWGVLIWKRKAEEALLASGLPYTIVRPGGMERPTDAYKETHNVTLSGEDTLFGGQVSNLQVAELIAFMAKNRSLSYCKVVEVIAETTAPLTPMGELLLKIPSQRDEVKPLKESDTAGGPRCAVLNSVVFEPPTAPVEKETARAKAMATMPLSPYIAYEDLKPPASPTPTPSTSAGATRATNGEAIPAALKSELSSMQINISKPTNAATEKEAVQMAVMKKSPLSPNTSYEDLKPPSSPSPTPSGPRERTLSDEVASHVVRGDDLAKISNNGVIEEDPPQGFTSHQSPYHAYDDLRPPTSPSPNAATGSLLPPSSSNGGSQMAKLLLNRTTQALPEDKQGDELRVVPKSRPLSPFTMYEDLKPPTSPRPSLTKS